MIHRIERQVTRIFKNRWFQRFARRAELTDAMLVEAIDRADAGLIDADLGGGVVKQRVGRPGSGRSSGYRTLVLFRRGTRAVFAFGFAKNAQANIDKADLAVLRDAARVMLALDAADIDRLVDFGELTEIQRGKED